MPTDERTGLRIVQDAWDRSEKTQNTRNQIYLRQWQRYKGFNPNVADASRSTMVMPKLYTAIETITPRITKAVAGKRPYIPIKSEKDKEGAKSIELGLDSYLYWAKFKIKLGQMIKVVGLLGTSFLEPVPFPKLVSERKEVESETFPWQPEMREVENSRFRLEVRQYMPWQVYVEPHMTSLDDPGFAIILDITPQSAIERMIESGRYQGITREDLTVAGEAHDKKFYEEMLSSLGIDQPEDDRDYGILMRYQSKERYITVWNGTTLLESIPNPYKHGEINIVRFAWNIDPMLQNSFWGQPEGKACEALLDKLDESRNQLADNNDIINQAIFGYREGVVDPHEIVMEGGARIEIAADFKGPIRDALDILETRGLPPDAYQMPEIYDNEIDRAMGNYAPNRGEPDPGKNQTATEASLISAQGDLRNEHRADMLENMGLSDFADRATSHIDQFAGLDDLLEVIGERALTVSTMNPHMIPGGAAYEFKGAATVIKDFQRKAEFRANLDSMQNNPAAKPVGILRKQCEFMEWSEQETNEVADTPEEFAEKMAMAQQAADRERALDLEADLIRAEANAAGKENKEQKSEQPKPKSSKAKPEKKAKAARTPNIVNPKGIAA